MTQSYEQIQKQIEVLQRQAAKLRDEEIAGVVERIKVAIAHYGLTIDQLGFAPGNAGKGKGKGKGSSKSDGRAKGQSRLSKSGAARGATQPKFADDKGNVWSGRGPRPRWLRDALAAGSTLTGFAVKGSSSAASRAANKVADKAPSQASALIPVRAKKQYQDGKGNVWSGMGPKPRWFKDALSGGATAAQLLAS